MVHKIIQGKWPEPDGKPSLSLDLRPLCSTTRADQAQAQRPPPCKDPKQHSGKELDIFYFQKCFQVVMVGERVEPYWIFLTFILWVSVGFEVQTRWAPVFPLVPGTPVPDWPAPPQPTPHKPAHPPPNPSPTLLPAHPSPILCPSPPPHSFCHPSPTHAPIWLRLLLLP